MLRSRGLESTNYRVRIEVRGFGPVTIVTTHRGYEIKVRVAIEARAWWIRLYDNGRRLRLRLEARC